MKIDKKGINLNATLLSGQCFRVKKEKDGSFTIILEDRVVNIKEENEYLIVTSNKEENLKEVIEKYLDLNRDYSEFNRVLSSKSEYLKKVVDYSKGYKILNQPILEMLISYTISQNNSVNNISLSIEKICKKFGKKVVFNELEYYLFPTINELSNVTKEDLRTCGVGFRDEYLINVINSLKENKNYFEILSNLNSEDALNELMKIKGIGLKVASCILLFAFNRLDVFPIDTWVKKHYETENVKVIKEKALKEFGGFSGLAIQYIFHYERNKNLL